MADNYNVLGSLADKIAKPSLGSSKIPACPKEFIFKYAKTFDPHWEIKGMQHAHNPFPRFKKECHQCLTTGYSEGGMCVYCDGTGYWNYLEKLVDMWVANPLMLVAKSRQVMVSWLFCALNLHLCMTKQSQVVFFISKKEDDAGFKHELSLLSRCWHIHNQLPSEMQMCTEKDKGLAPPILKFPDTGSSIMGCSQESDTLRQYTASSILWDEMAFQNMDSRVYKAVRPTLGSGGRLTGVSTPDGKQNLFYRMVHDVRSD